MASQAQDDDRRFVLDTMIVKAILVSGDAAWLADFLGDRVVVPRMVCTELGWLARNRPALAQALEPFPFAIPSPLTRAEQIDVRSIQSLFDDGKNNEGECECAVIAERFGESGWFVTADRTAINVFCDPATHFSGSLGGSREFFQALALGMRDEAERERVWRMFSLVESGDRPLRPDDERRSKFFNSARRSPIAPIKPAAAVVRPSEPLTHSRSNVSAEPIHQGGAVSATTSAPRVGADASRRRAQPHTTKGIRARRLRLVKQYNYSAPLARLDLGLAAWPLSNRLDILNASEKALRDALERAGQPDNAFDPNRPAAVVKTLARETESAQTEVEQLDELLQAADDEERTPPAEPATRRWWQRLPFGQKQDAGPTEVRTPASDGTSALRQQREEAAAHVQLLERASTAASKYVINSRMVAIGRRAVLDTVDIDRFPFLVEVGFHRTASAEQCAAVEEVLRTREELGITDQQHALGFPLTETPLEEVGRLATDMRGGARAERSKQSSARLA